MTDKSIIIENFNCYYRGNRALVIMKKHMRLFFMLVIGVFSFFLCKAEEEMEILPISSLLWSTNANLSVVNNSTIDYDVWNHNANTAGKGHWTAEKIYLNLSELSQIKPNRPFGLTFRIGNSNNDPNSKYRVYKTSNRGKEEAWHDGNIYWGYSIDMLGTNNGTSSFTQYFSDRKSRNSANSFTDEWNSDNQTWTCTRDFSVKNYLLEFDGNNTATLSITDDGNSFERVKVFSNVKAIKTLCIILGSAADIHLFGLAYYQTTEYGMVKPEIEKSLAACNAGDYSSAISIATRVLEKYRSAEPFFVRGLAFLARQYYKSAIEDFTSALSYNCEEDFRVKIYLRRGICYLSINDLDNGVSDMLKAGVEGQAFLKEYGLDKYSQDGGKMAKPSLKKKTAESFDDIFKKNKKSQSSSNAGKKKFPTIDSRVEKK